MLVHCAAIQKGNNVKQLGAGVWGASGALTENPQEHFFFHVFCSLFYLAQKSFTELVQF
jgi:hypothetical protein